MFGFCSQNIWKFELIFKNVLTVNEDAIYCSLYVSMTNDSFLCFKTLFMLLATNTVLQSNKL